MNFAHRLSFSLHGEPAVYRTLNVDDVGERYVHALREQRRFLNNNPPSVTVDWQKQYVQRILDSDQDTIAGLFINDVLAATSGIQSITPAGMATVGVFVLNPERRGRGLGKTLVWAASTLIPLTTAVAGVQADMVKSNTASLRAFLACGFTIVAETDTAYVVSLCPSDLRQPDFLSDIRVTRER